MKMAINTGVVGYGLSGRVFHAPFVSTNRKFNLSAIVTSGNDASKAYPQSNIFRKFEDLIQEPEIDLVVLCTPHQLHAEQAIYAMEAGKHVVIEKPVAMSSSDVERITKTAVNTGKTVFPYHNRRWDGDFLTLRKIMYEGHLGEVLDFESRIDRYQPKVTRAGWRYNQPDAGGTLFDLGPHLIDQAICLFGPPHSVWCQLLFQRPDSKANDSFELRLIYPKLSATLKAGVFFREPGPRFLVSGTLGTYIKYGIDPQEESLKKGKTPDSTKFGHEPKRMHGLLHSVAHGATRKVKYQTLPGSYMDFYDDVADSLSGMKQPEVNMDHARLNIKIIEAAMRSHNEKKVINLMD